MNPQVKMEENRQEFMKFLSNYFTTKAKDSIPDKNYQITRSGILPRSSELG